MRHRPDAAVSDQTLARIPADPTETGRVFREWRRAIRRTSYLGAHHISSRSPSPLHLLGLAPRRSVSMSRPGETSSRSVVTRCHHEHVSKDATLSRKSRATPSATVAISYEFLCRPCHIIAQSTSDRRPIVGKCRKILAVTVCQSRMMQEDRDHQTVITILKVCESWHSSVRSTHRRGSV